MCSSSLKMYVPFSFFMLMSVAHFYPRKTRCTMPEASAIKPVHVTAISDSRRDWGTHVPSFGVIALISSHRHLIVRPSLDYSDLRGLSNLSVESMDCLLTSVTWLSIPNHRLAGASRWNFTPDPCCGSPKWLATLNGHGIVPCHGSILGLAPATSCVCYFSFLSCRFLVVRVLALQKMRNEFSFYSVASPFYCIPYRDHI
jgi:hypothetical protein